LEEVQKHLENNESFVIRFKSMGNPEETFEIDDAIRGRLSMQVTFRT